MRRYLVGDLSLDDFSREVDRLWQELQTSPALRERTASYGVPLKDLDQIPRLEAMTLRREGFGLDPAVTAIVVSFSPALVHILNSLWDRVFLPILLERLGRDALQSADQD